MASNYPTVQYGSRGETVRQLQRALNQVGYSLEVDGGFGPKTKAAVIDYQKKNNLRVDGVAGSEPMGSLLSKIGTVSGGYSNSKQVLSGVSDETADALYRLEKGYTPSDEVKAAQSVVDSMNALKPGAYQSGFEGQLAATIDRPCPTIRQRMPPIGAMRRSIPGRGRRPWRTPWAAARH